MERQRHLSPVHEVGAHGVRPMHVLPFALKRVVLVEQMILAFIINESVGVVYPSASRREMILRTVFLLIHILPSSYAVVLINLGESLPAAVVGQRDGLALQRAHVAERPVVGLSLGKTYDEAACLSALYRHLHGLPVRLVGDREIDVLLCNLDFYVSRISHGHASESQRGRQE